MEHEASRRKEWMDEKKTGREEVFSRIYEGAGLPRAFA